MQTIPRNKLLKLWESGQVQCLSVKCNGGDGDSWTRPLQRQDFGPGARCYLDTHGEIILSDGSIYARMKLVNGDNASLTRPGVSKAQRPENARMQAFLAANGVQATPKYIPDGSMRGCWRLYNPDLRWSMDWAAKLNALGFTDCFCEPLGQFSGNGGSWMVFVRGHNELLQEAA